MTTRFPRRVKDLLQYGVDSEDEFNTPRKPEKPKEDAAPMKNDLKLETRSNTENKENAVWNNGYRTGASIKPATRMLPKRRSELVMVDSDSEEEEGTRSNNLNCAILNDSFLLSPNDDITNSRESSAKKVTKQIDNNLSLLCKFDNMGISGKSEQQNSASNNTTKQTSPSSITSESANVRPQTGQHIGATTLQPITEDQVIEVEQIVENETPMRIAAQPLTKANSAMSGISTNTATNTAAHTDAQFATPQVRTFSVTRRPRADLCSTQSQKTRAAIANEFRSQKVLFQTPMAVARSMPLPNDSISLSLCDTINESINTPNTAEKTPQTVPKPTSTLAANVKTKKSLEGAFQQTEIKPATEDKSKAAAQTTTAVSSTTTATTTSSSSSSSTVLNINSKEYIIIKKLGCGGSSSVYLAQRKDNGKECALKVVDLHGDPAVVEGYLNETKLLAKLQGNVCVVSLFDYQLLRKESTLYMVMEKGDSDLNKILQTYTTKLPLYVLMNFLYQMLQAVNYIHQNGVIHSDLKPANFLMVNGRLKLIDFGIASNIAIDSTSIIKFSQAGTFNYISPEALTDTSTGSSPMRSNQPKIKISTKSDVWSLGCILYLLLYQKTPFSHIKNIYQKISAISSPNTIIDYPSLPIFYPPMLLHMAKNCLQHNPKQRLSCADLLKYPFNMIIPIQNLSVPANTQS